MRLFIIVFMLAFHSISNAQEFIGGEILIERTEILFGIYDVRVELYYRGAEIVDKPSLSMDYNFGFEENAYLQEHNFLDNDIQHLVYLDTLIIDSPTNHPVVVRDTFTLSPLVNLQGTNKDKFVLKTDILDLDNFWFWYNVLPKFSKLQTEIDRFDDIIVHDLAVEDPDTINDYSYQFELFADTEGYEYSLPEAEEDIFITEEGKFIWSQPVEEGKYLVQFNVYEFVANSNYLLSTTRRVMIIDTEADFSVSTNQQQKENLTFSIAPNPTSQNINLHLQDLPAATTATITLLDPFGKAVLTTRQALQAQHTLEVAHLPAGVYFLVIEMEGQRYVEKVVVQR